MLKLFQLFFYSISIQFQLGICNISDNSEDAQKFTIEENQPVKTFVGRIKFHKESEDKFTYSFSEVSEMFYIDSKSGDILTSKIIDLEALCINTCVDNIGRISLSVNIRKQKDLITMVKVLVSILDVDDNKPEFEQKEYVMEIKEVIYRKNMVISLPSAVDKDVLPKNREITYRITGDHSAFILEENNLQRPKLRLLIDIDYEKQKQYRFILCAYQKLDEDMSAKLNVTLNVVNINDCAPEFSKTLYEVSVFEDVVLDELLTKVCYFP